MSLIDTHCHLDAAEFAETRRQVLDAARAAGIGSIVIPSVSRDNFADVKRISETFPDCHVAFGIHPMFTKDAQQRDLATLEEYLKTCRPVAIGEIGLDFFIEDFDRATQQYYFSEQLRLAREFDLPVLIHSRKSLDAVLMLLRKIRVKGGIMHAFNGSIQQAEELVAMGFMLGFGGAATYPRATRLRSLVVSLPLDCIVLETDAPDMPPEFIEKGQPNKPEYLAKIAQILAGLRGIPHDELATATTENALHVLPKLRTERISACA